MEDSKQVCLTGEMVIISAGVWRKGARLGRVTNKTAAVRRADAQQNYVTPIRAGPSQNFLSIPGTLGQRGSRVTGQTGTSTALYKGRVTLVGNRENPIQNTMDTRRAKTANRDSMQGETASSGDVSSTKSMSSPGRARKVSMKIKKGLKEVKGMLSLHRHQQQQQRRKPGPNESRRGPLGPVLDHLERNNSVPIHLHISQTGSFSVSRKASSSSYSCSDLAHDESKTSADIHQHIQQEQPQQSQQGQQSTTETEPETPRPDPQPAMEVPEPYVAPPSPQRSDDGEETPNPFLVDDPEDPLSDPGSPPPAPVLPLDPGSLLPETSPSELVSLSPAPSSEPSLPVEPTPPSPVVDKPVPPLPVVSDTESEQEAPAIHLPQLVMPTMFLPIPNVRINSYLTWWLTRRTPVYY